MLRHFRDASGKRIPNYYSEVLHFDPNAVGVEEHPIDIAVKGVSGHASLRKRIRRLTATLLSVVGPRKQSWLELEDALRRYRTDREEAFFSFGYDRGVIAGRAEALAASACGGRARSDLAAWLRDLTVEARPHGKLKVAMLLELAHALVLGVESDEPRARGQSRKARR